MPNNRQGKSICASISLLVPTVNDIKPLWTHSRTKAYPQSTPFILSATSLFQVTLTNFPFSSLSSQTLFYRPMVAIVTKCPSIISVTWHFVPMYTFSFNCGQDVFYFGLLPNSWFSLPISQCYVKHHISIPFWPLWYFCSRTFVILHVSDPYVRTGRIHW